MSNAVDNILDAKIKTFAELETILSEKRKKGLKIVQCHGVFDLLHPGHIRHFKDARSKGDCLVATVTPDRFVNKGPGRPAFTETLRLESLAALSDIDYVVLNDSPDAVSAIRQVRPHFYVKGIEYQNHASDVTGKISEEAQAVENLGGKILYTDDIVFSSSSLLNRYFESYPPKVSEFIQRLKKVYSLEEVLQKIEDLSKLKVLVVGDAIIDEYQYVEPLGQSGKGLHMVARCLDKEVFLGGSLIIANHVAQFAREVHLLTAVGKECPYLNFIRHHLAPNVSTDFAYLDETTTLVKKRYVSKDGKNLFKLFETYSGQDEHLNEEQTERFLKFIGKQSSEYDLILVADFGNGFTNHRLIDALSETKKFLSLNTQINSGNRGYNVVTNYRRADYISLNEPELRLSAHDKTSALEGIVADIGQIMGCKFFSITRGVQGVLCFGMSDPVIEIPPFTTTSVDRIGAGDSYLSLSSLCLAKGYPMLLAGFIGSIAAAMSVQIVGNQEPVKKAPLCKFITRLLK
jgi:cytidyltransferase-like protein